MDRETGPPYSTNWKDTSYDLILGVTDRLTKILRDEPVQTELMQPASLTQSSTKTQSSPPSSGSSGTTREFDCDYHLRVFYENIQESHDCMQREPSALACEIANPFPPDLWGYVHRFSY